MGRLTDRVEGKWLSGGVVRATSDGRTLDLSSTDGAGRFLLGWEDLGEGKASIELLDGTGRVSESMTLTASELVIPPVVVFSGSGVLKQRPERDVGPDGGFWADGDAPLTVASSCMRVTLSWRTGDEGSVSMLRDGAPYKDGLPSEGSLQVVEEETTRYILRSAARDRTVEVRRCPSLSLVIDGPGVVRMGDLGVGVLTSCPAGPDGLCVSVLSSDPLVATETTLTIAPGDTWATGRVRLGRVPGPVELVASAPGYSRDGVKLEVV